MPRQARSSKSPRLFSQHKRQLLISKPHTDLQHLSVGHPTLTARIPGIMSSRVSLSQQNHPPFYWAGLQGWHTLCSQLSHCRTSSKAATATVVLGAGDSYGVSSPLQPFPEQTAQHPSLPGFEMQHKPYSFSGSPTIGIYTGRLLQVQHWALRHRNSCWINL